MPYSSNMEMENTVLNSIRTCHLTGKKAKLIIIMMCDKSCYISIHRMP